MFYLQSHHAYGQLDEMDVVHMERRRILDTNCFVERVLFSCKVVNPFFNLE